MDNISEIPFSLSARLVRFEDRFAVLSHEALGEFRWPIKNLPENLKIGDSVTLKIATPKIEEEEKYGRMRKLLEELIN
ncbi:hypothetical protein HYW83_05705 [Candidatus Peregrinibacteria bacterium]|nr:hypothetical protein [Candidatus Peregrinibacteria bacterium]